MENQFSRRTMRCLQSLNSQGQQREETQELRLPEGMPDIGRVLGCWGQIVLRGKEWRSGGMNISGGIMAWVLYAPEDGGTVQSVETWIPFQQKWEFDDGGRDGFIFVHPLLKSIDARSTSARKFMIRANISTQSSALQSVEVDIYEPDGVPEDVELLRQTYPLEVPMEFGEKQFQLEEDLVLPDTYPPIDKILRAELIPCMTEQRILGSRLVFRGEGKLHLLYQSEEDIRSFDTQILFSQYADLDRDYGTAASAEILPLVTNLELEKTDGKWILKAGLTAQFMVWDRAMVGIVEDAYSPVRTVEPMCMPLKLVSRLDRWEESVPVVAAIRGDIGKIVDICQMMDHPQRRQSGDSAEMNFSGGINALFYDPNGNLQTSAARFEIPVSVPSCSANVITGCVIDQSPCQISMDGEGLKWSRDITVDFGVLTQDGPTMVTGLSLGEAHSPDENRPSLILRRCEIGDLWKIAKESGSTVEAIRNANGLQGQPQNGQLLLIPVL